MPIERFKDSYANWRYNPFTNADMSVNKTENGLTVPTSAPFTLQLLEVPRKDTPSTVSVYCVTDGIYFTEVTTSPTQGQFRVDYPSPDGKGTGLIEFNQNDAGKTINVSYKATGSPIIAEFLDTKVSYPAGTPNDNQIIAFVGGAPQWRNNPIRYFHEGNVIYHSSGESESSVLFRFKKTSYESKVLLELKGSKLHQGYYTELASHSHGVGTLGTSSEGSHYHGVNAHAHGAGTLTGSQPTHQHFYVPGSGPGILTDPAGNDAVTITGSTTSESGLTDTQGSHTHTLSGSTATAGVSAKTYPNSLKVYINGIDKTANILAKSGLTALGDGTSTHPFVTTGTGEMDITDLVSTNQMHEIKITEPISGAGGRVLIHLELY